MNRPYGPWATLITAGQSPQLSTFWRRRMKMLATVSRTSSMLSRRNVALLTAAAFFVFLLPTFRAAPVAAQDEKSSKAKSQDQKSDERVTEHSPAPSSHARGDDSAAKQPATTPATFERVLILPGYAFLQSSSDRKEIGIGGEQERKLREISAGFEAAQRKLVFTKEMAQLPPKEQTAKQEELQRTSKEITKRFRGQIAEVLTTQQRADYQRFVRGRLGLGLLSTPKQTSELWGFSLSQQQKEQLHRLEEKWAREGEQHFRQFKDGLLGVLTPEQRQRLAAKFADANVAGPFVNVPGPSDLHFTAVKSEKPFVYVFFSPDGASVWVYRELADSEVRKQLGLSARQETKLRAVLSDSQAAAEKIFAVYESKRPAKLSPGEQESRRAEYRRKLEELGKDIIRQIDATLTPQQVAALNKAGRQEKEIEALVRPDQEFPSYLGATSEQKAKLQRAFQEFTGPSSLEKSREVGDQAWLILTPDQVKKIQDMFDRNGL